MVQLGIDTGGTFTDFALLGNDGLITLKLPSTPADPSIAIMQGIEHLLGNPDSVEIIHGTTVGTNAFLQRKGAHTLLITTHGFEDVLFIGRQNRQRIYDLNLCRPAPIIGSDSIVGVRERTLYDGSVLTPLGNTVGRRLRRLCREKRIESVAVCLLHSYANPAHEQAIGRALANLGLPVTLSSNILPEFREYERLTTTLINAYLSPVISRYITRLAAQLPGVPLSIQQSNGGLLPAKGIGERAAHTILSGPAGGVQGAWLLARQLDLDQIITFDMGGTSTDVSLCAGGLSLTRDYRIDGFPIRNQVIDIHTVGAGGGSIAKVDHGGLLHVGPASAGAEPGPACYGRGEDLTVTDANLLLGRIPDHLLGGTMTLDRDRTRHLFERLGRRLSMSGEQVALGMIRIVNAGMAKAIREVSLERGHSPKDFSLFSYGGASGLHCLELALELGMKQIVVPARAGILSAQGMVMTAPSLDFSQSLFLRGAEIRSGMLEKHMDRLTKLARQELTSLYPDSNITVAPAIDLRYQGQSHELSVPYTQDTLMHFHRQHEHLFGYAMPNASLEIVSIRCTAKVERQPPTLPREHTPHQTAARPQTTSDIVMPNGMQHPTPIFSRWELHWGHSITGPALIVDSYTTILILSGSRLTVDPWLNLIITPAF